MQKFRRAKGELKGEEVQGRKKRMDGEREGGRVGT